MKSIGMRALLVGVILLVGIIVLVPSFTSTLPPGWTKVLPKDKIHLGLDLQGGIHLVLEVEADKAVENAAERFAEEIKDALRAAEGRFHPGCQNEQLGYRSDASRSRPGGRSQGR